MDFIENHNTVCDSDIMISDVISVMTETYEVSSPSKSSPKGFARRKLFYIYEGNYSLTYNSKKHHIKSGDIIIIPSGMQYTCDYVPGKIRFCGIYFQGNASEDDFFNSFHHFNNSLHLKDRINEINSTFNSDTCGKKVILKKQLYGILAKLISQANTKMAFSPEYYTIKKGTDYLLNNYTRNDISVSFLANLCNITPTYFSVLFKKFFNKSPKQYIIDLRIKKAKEYIEFSAYSISEISEKLGYTAPVYFSSAFKKATGLSPYSFRKTH